MDKQEFLARILNLYGRFLDEEAKTVWIKSCHSVLDDNLNFENFWWYFCREFDTKTLNNIPSCQWLYQASGQFKPVQDTVKQNIRKEPPPIEWYKLKQRLEEITGRKLKAKNLPIYEE